MKKYEYKYVKLDLSFGFDFDKKIHESEAEWNRLGKEGWKFCSWGNGVAIFMREIES